MNKKDFDNLKLELKREAKCGVDFIFTASILWLAITYIWTMNYTAYDTSIFTFVISAFLMPLAFAFSKLFKTNWKVKDNPLQSLGLWLNFAQLIYFPILFFILIKDANYFVLGYAIITGAHLFPYAWLYDEKIYAVIAPLISVASLVLTIIFGIEKIWIIPLFTALTLVFTVIWLSLKNKNK